MKTITYTTYTKIVGSIIHAKRKIAGLSQGDVVKELGIFQSSISRLELGDSEITVARLYELSFIINDCEVAEVMRLAGVIESQMIREGISVIGHGKLLSETDTVVLLPIEHTIGMVYHHLYLEKDKDNSRLRVVVS